MGTEAKSNEVLSTDIEYMQKGIDRIDSKLSKFIDKADDRYASKEEYEHNKETIASINKEVEWIQKNWSKTFITLAATLWTTAVTVIIFLWKLVIDFYLNK